jgi:phage RecT family recombinase
MANEQQNGQMVQTKTTSGTIARWLDNDQINKQLIGALAGYMDASTFKAQCALAASDPNLNKCTPASLFQAFLTCAQMGLIPGKHHGHVALIPRENKSTGEYTCDVMPQWQGYKFLMERQPGIKRVTPMLVHYADTFTVNNGEVFHQFDPFDDERQFKHPSDATDAVDAGLRGAYLKIEHDDGEVRYHFTSLAKIHANMACSQTPDLDKFNKPGVWRKWFPEQCLKTALRDAWARRAVSIDPQLASRLGVADDVDNAVLVNDPTRALPNEALPALAVEVVVQAPAKGNDRLAAKLAPKSQEARQAPQTAGTASDRPEGENANHAATATAATVVCVNCQRVQKPGECDAFGCVDCQGKPQDAFT